MSTHREPEKKGLEKVGARVRQRAMSGTEASTVGFVLVLYVFAGAGLGYLADQFLETNWIVGAGVLLGSALGFREMFRMIKKISRIEESASETPEASERKTASVPQFETRSSEIETPDAPVESEETIEEPESSARGFHIPPPPTASFDKPDNNPESPR
jgi:F0F1-type ATP synthase assembly protein I